MQFDFIISNLLLLLKCLGFADISADVNWVNFYSKDGRILMAAGEKVRVVVDTLIDVDQDIDVCVDCKKLIDYVNYIKGFGSDGTCSLLLKDDVFQIKDKSTNKIKNYLYLDYISEATTKIRAKNFEKIVTLPFDVMNGGMCFAATGADNSEKYSAQTVGMLIKTVDDELCLAGTDSVRCCIYKAAAEVEVDHELVIPSATARAVSNISSLLKKDADLGYSSTYFRCNFNNVAVYSSKINLDFPPIAPLMNITGSTIAVEKKSFVNILRGANIAAKGKQDSRVNISVVENLLRVYSVGFDVTMELDNALIGENVDIPLNAAFLYSLCSLFKSDSINLQFSKTATKLSDNTGERVAFIAPLK